MVWPTGKIIWMVMFPFCMEFQTTGWSWKRRFWFSEWKTIIILSANQRIILCLWSSYIKDGACPHEYNEGPQLLTLSHCVVTIAQLSSKWLSMRPGIHFITLLRKVNGYYSDQLWTENFLVQKLQGVCRLYVWHVCYLQRKTQCKYNKVWLVRT